MDSLNIIDANKKTVGTYPLAPSFFEKKIHRGLLFDAVKAHLASKHHGTVDTKTRSEVNRTGKKIYRQKGTGNARHGSRKTAPFVGGGVVFGPHPRSYTLNLSKKVKKKVLKEALKHQLIENKVVVVDSIPLTEIKTKKALEFFKGINVSSALVVLDVRSDVTQKSVRNLKGYQVVLASQVGVYDLLEYAQVVFTKEGLKQFEKRCLL